VNQNRRLTASEVFEMGLDAELRGEADKADSYYLALDRAGLFTEACGSFAFQQDSASQHDRAMEALRAGARRRPDDAVILQRLAWAHLRRGDFEEGWRLHEHRQIEITAHMRGRPKLKTPEWNGGPISSLLVILEQGLGDQIMFVRFAAALQKRGIDVTFACAPQLIRLFQPLGLRLLPATGSIDVKTDAWAMMMSLPFLMGTQLETIPPAPYLRSLPGGSGIGVMTSGNAAQARDHSRSLPPALAQQLLELPGAVNLDPLVTGVRDFEDTARIIDRLELVITVDTSVAHLAGAMGKPVWILVSRPPDWRWMYDREDSPWYPTARLFRQPRVGDWESVIHRIKTSLSA
jgi:hypothetical protein